jgi:2-phosphosulfolactate phosphatase
MSMTDQLSLEVVFSPKLYEHKLTSGSFVTVVVDILRATTSMCAALDFGVTSIIPVAGSAVARKYKEKGFLVACERDGRILDFADIGNSPSEFLKSELRGQDIVFSTTNGTKTIEKAADADTVTIGSFLNISALADWLIGQNKNVIILCAAWKNLFNLEDTVFAGALSEKLMASGRYTTVCDSTKAALDLWEKASSDLPGYLSKSSHRNRLKHLVSEWDYNYTLTPDSSTVIPVLREGSLVSYPAASHSETKN